MLLKSFAISAVDVFVLITGYFSYKHRSTGITKVIELLAQVSAFGLARYLLSCMLDREMPTGFGAFLHLLPRNWFIVIYAALHLVLIYLNAGFERLSQPQAKTFLSVLLVLFAGWPTLVDVLEAASGEPLPGLSTIGQQGSEFGYTIVTFVLMYLIGAYFGKYDVKKRTGRLLFTLAACILVLYIWMHFDVSTATEYCNPIIICEASAIFLLFTKIKLQSRFINTLAKAALTVYLIHPALLGHIGINRFINSNTVFLLLHILISCCAIYLAGWLIWRLWDKVTTPLWNYIDRNVCFQLNVGALERND